MIATGTLNVCINNQSLHQFLLLGFLSFQIPSVSAWVFNNPYPDDNPKEVIYYSSFNEQPKTLDPAKSYSANEYQFIGQIYEPLLQYDYQKRPYTLIPLTLEKLPEIKYLDAKGKVLADAANPDRAFTLYTLCIKPGIRYQPHPALAKNKAGSYLYHQLDRDYIENNAINRLSDFKVTGTREMQVDDYIYQIKRMANPATGSPVYGLLSDYILGFKDFALKLPKDQNYIDLRKYSLEGVEKINDQCFSIKIKGLYTQFAYWMAMPFFSPIPWEVDVFYSQPDMDDNNLSLAWYPIGTGPFMLTENNPNRRMVLEKNPNYRLVYFPGEGSIEQKGKLLPLIDKAVYSLEKESIPRWNKFLQGYYDTSGVSSDSFDQAIRINNRQQLELTPEMEAKKLHLIQTPEFSEYYFGFNMRDPVVGGSSERSRKLRQAISIAINEEEQIAIFYNGRGHAAQGPLPPGIFGYKKEDINPWVYTWKEDRPQRRSIMEAKKLLTEAGYPEGKDPATGRALTLYYDVSVTGSPDDKAQLDWMTKQFAKLGIELNIRATLYNSFQEKMRNGNAQIFSWGWMADYPDPENFFFLLYGPNAKVKFGGENAANYSNPEFDALFRRMKNMANDEERQQIIDQMLALVRKDSPWVWGINSEGLMLGQDWMAPILPNSIAQNTLQYLAIDMEKRNKMRACFNQPLLWPVLWIALFFLILLIPLFYVYKSKENSPAPRQH